MGILLMGLKGLRLLAWCTKADTEKYFRVILEYIYIYFSFFSV